MSTCKDVLNAVKYLRWMSTYYVILVEGNTVLLPPFAIIAIFPNELLQQATQCFNRISFSLLFTSLLMWSSIPNHRDTID